MAVVDIRRGDRSFRGPFKYTNLNGAATTTIKSAPGVLHSIVVNTALATSATVYDNTAGSGTKIASIGAAGIGATLIFDIAFTTGLTIVVVGAGDLTVTWT